MKLIADGGSTKVQWIMVSGVADGHASETFVTRGLNPSVMTTDEITAILRHDFSSTPYALTADKVEYYGAGCRGAASEAMEGVLRAIFPIAQKITVGSDMLGACRAVAPEGEMSIVCILGTGANSCLYDGNEIIDNVPPLGYILGDEGSGTWLGKRLLHAVLKENLPQELLHSFRNTYPIGYDEIIRRIYRPAAADGAPNAFVASFAPFMSTHIGHPEIAAMVREGFDRFLTANALLYFRRHQSLSPTTGLHFVGSIAATFATQLSEACSAHSLRLASVRSTPLS